MVMMVIVSRQAHLNQRKNAGARNVGVKHVRLEHILVVVVHARISAQVILTVVMKLLPLHPLQHILNVQAIVTAILFWVVRKDIQGHQQNARGACLV